MCYRNSGAERRRERGGNAGNHVEADAMFRQIFGFFSAAAEQEWIAALQANYGLAFARLVDEQFVDLVLTRIVTADRFAHVNALSGRFRQRQHVFLNQPVVNNDIRRLDQVCRLNRQQLRMPRACSNQINFSRSSHFKSHYFTYSLPLQLSVFSKRRCRGTHVPRLTVRIYRVSRTMMMSKPIPVKNVYQINFFSTISSGSYSILRISSENRGCEGFGAIVGFAISHPFRSGGSMPWKNNHEIARPIQIM